MATQIFEILQKFSEYHESLKCVLFVGGTSVKENSEEYSSNGGQVIVATPGRIIDFVNRFHEINFKRLEVLILDEADKLLDMGFKDSITQILGMLPKQRRTGLFSATQTKEVTELARAGLRNPVTVSVKIQLKTDNQKSIEKVSLATPSSLDNWYLIREYDDRLSELMKFIKIHNNEKIIIFCSTCACVDYYSSVFQQLSKTGKYFLQDTKVVGFHGKMVPKKRTELYKKFKNLNSGIMFSTDVAARGIDIPDVDWIIQLAAPKDPAFFVHRVGRTARAGKKGGALLFITADEEPYIELLRGRGVPLRNGEIDPLISGFSKLYDDSFDIKINNSELLNDIKDLAKSDRDLLESGSTAFISFIRAYKENLCSYIFRLEKLDIGALARSYGLLRLPKIAETRGVKGKPIIFETDTVDTSTIPYKHHEKEKARVTRLNASIAQEENEKNKTKEIKKTWVPAEEFERVDKKRERKKKKNAFIKLKEEWDELAAEEMAFKKFKKGKMSKDKYESCLFSDKVLEIDDLENPKNLDSSDFDESD